MHLGTIWMNKKTRGIYNVIGKVINTTNEQDGQVMIRYQLQGTQLFHEPEFVREESEFLLKFKPLQVSIEHE